MCSPYACMHTEHRKTRWMHMYNLLFVHCNLDVDECTDFNGGCQDNCTNTIGSYYCACDDGYILENDSNCSIG